MKFLNLILAIGITVGVSPQSSLAKEKKILNSHSHLQLLEIQAQEKKSKPVYKPIVDPSGQKVSSRSEGKVRYALPDAAFHPGYILEEFNTIVDGVPLYLYIPPVEIPWTNISDIENGQYEWTYGVLDEETTEAPFYNNVTIKSTNLTTPAYSSLYNGTPNFHKNYYRRPQVPILSMGDQSYQMKDGGLIAGGALVQSFVNWPDEIMSISKTPINKSIETYMNDIIFDDEAEMSRLINFLFEKEIEPDKPFHVVSYVQEIRKPENGVLGIKRVIPDLVLFSDYSGDSFNVDFYEKKWDEEKGRWVLGEHLAGGATSSEEIYPPYVPISRIDDGVVIDGFFNVDRDVFMVFSGFGPDDFMTIGNNAAIDGSPLLDRPTAWLYGYVDGEEELILENAANWLLPCWADTDGDDPSYGMRCNQFTVFYDACYNTLAKPGEVYEIDVPAEGGSKILEFQSMYPLFDLYRVDGDVWAIEDPVGDYEVATGLQKVKFTVDPLPEGETSREGKMIMEVPGARQEIIIRQGDAASLTSIQEAKEVVGSYYYDVYGRQLNAAPQSGMVIRKDVNSDNTVTISKILK